MGGMTNGIQGEWAWEGVDPKGGGVKGWKGTRMERWRD